MNKDRRGRLSNIVEQLESLKESLDELGGEEQECLDNLPEGLQCSEKGNLMDHAINSIDMAGICIDDAINEINEAAG